MLEKLHYRNHLGEGIIFGQDGFFVNENDLRDFTWGYTSKNNRISSFQKGVVKKTLNVIIACTSEEDGLAKRNILFEICEKDVLANNHGKIIIGAYYMKCFVIGSKKTEYLYNDHTMKVKLTVVTDFPVWVKESTTIFRVEGEGGSTEGLYLDYPYDFPFDYAYELAMQNLINEGFVATNFRLVIYGSCSKPRIFIGGHEYLINTDVGNGEYLVIDSSEKTIMLVRSNGEMENRFNSRNRSSYVFEKIPVGANAVTWEGDFGFDVTLLEERSEPKWI